MKKTALAILVTTALTGCHSLRFDIAPESASQPVSTMKSFFLWGLVPTKKIDLAQYCPNGTAAVSEETTFLDGLCGVVTLGIWSPRTSRYYCLEGAPNNA